MPSATYVIEIASSMPDGESTIAELDKLTANLMGSGKGAEHFQQALKQVSSALDAAKKVSEAANASLAAGAEEYKVLERAALQSAKAAEKAAQSGKLDPSMARDAHLAAAAVDDYARKLKGLEADAADASKKQDTLTKSLAGVQKLSTHVNDSLTKQAEATGKLKGALAAIGGPLGQLGSAVLAPVDGFAKLSTTMGASNAAALVAAAGVAAVAAAVAAATIVVIAGTIAIASWAVGLADTRREAGLATEAFEVMNPAVESLHDTIDGLTDQTGLSESAIDAIAKSLIAAKVSAADLPAALEAASLAERALGNGGANDFLADMKASKKSVKDFAAETKTQLGGVVAKQMLGLGAQTATLKTNIGRIFGDLDIDPVLTGFQKLVGLFDENSSAGEAMKFLFTTVFQPLIDQADNAATVIEAFVLGFLIGLTKVYIAIKPALKAAESFFGFKDASLTNTLAFVTKAAEYLAPVFLVVVGVVGAFALAVGVAVAVALAMQVAVYALVTAFLYIGGVIISSVYNAFMSVSKYLSSIDLSTVGANILQGLANGITGAATFVVDAVSNAVKGAIKSAKSALGIASPSKVFAEIGAFTGEGMAVGLDDSAAQVQASMTDMVAPPDASKLSEQDSLSGNAGGSAAPASASKSAASSGDSGGGIHINLAGAHLEFNGVKDGPEALEQFKEMLTKCYEEDAASAGVASDQAEAE